MSRSAEWSRVLSGARRPEQVEDRDDLLGRALALGGDVDGDVVGCSLTVETPTGWTTPHSSHPVATILDGAQYDAGCGPCVEAATTGQVQELDLIAADGRFAAFAAVAAENGVLSSLSVPLPQAPHRSALNIYARHPGAFSAARGREVAGLLARVVARVLDASELAGRRAAPEADAAAAQGVIVQEAVAMLAGQAACTTDEAYLQLAVRSRREGRAMGHLAAAALAGEGPSEAVSA